MRTWIVVVAVAACQSGDHDVPPKPAPLAPPPAAPPVPQLELVRCVAATLAPRAQLPVKTAARDAIGANLGSQGGAAIGYLGHSDLMGHHAPSPLVTVGAGVVDGGLTPELVRRTLRRDLGAMTNCYAQALVTKPKLAGTIKLRLEIGLDGAVTSANAVGFDPSVAACVQHRGATLAFPRPVALTTAAFPITFAPQTADGWAGKPSEPAVAVPARIGDVHAWTPYAAGDGLAPDDIATTAATELGKAIADRLEVIDGCYADKHGSTRALLQVAFDGGVIDARVGGLGDRDAEACIATKLVGLKVNPPPIASEVACDFVRGDPQPWRVTLDAGYDVIEVANGKSSAPAASDGKTAFLIVVDPDVPGAQLARTLSATSESAATLVAVKTDAGPPVFMGMGPDGRTRETGGEPPTQIRIDGAVACAGDKIVATSGDVIAALAKECTADPTCTSTLTIHPSQLAGDLGAIANKARLGGFDRILIGGAACPKK